MKNMVAAFNFLVKFLKVTQIWNIFNCVDLFLKLSIF